MRIIHNFAPLPIDQVLHILRYMLNITRLQRRQRRISSEYSSLELKGAVFEGTDTVNNVERHLGVMCSQES